MSIHENQAAKFTAEEEEEEEKENGNSPNTPNGSIDGSNWPHSWPGYSRKAKRPEPFFAIFTKTDTLAVFKDLKQACEYLQEQLKFNPELTLSVFKPTNEQYEAHLSALRAEKRFQRSS